MKQDYSSFLSEHTVEYILVPKLINILKQKFEIVIPVYPWLSREGSNFSKTINNQKKFNVLGLYPKRPKINLKDQKILIKVNMEFLEGAKEASKFNIPMILGCPLMRNLWDFNDNTKCIWINLSDKTKSFYNIEYNDKLFPEYTILQNEQVLTNNEDILHFVINNSQEINFNKLIEAFKRIKEHGVTDAFMRFVSCKSVYLIFK